MEELNFVCLGDSLTAGSPGFSGYSGWSGNPKSQYEYWLEQKAIASFPGREIEFLNFGVGGNVVWQMLYRFKKDVPRFVEHIDYVLIFAGINDLLGHCAMPQDVLTDLAELYEAVVQAKGKVIALEIAPSTVTKLYSQRIKETNKGIAALAEKMKFPVVPIYKALADASGNGLFADYDIGDGVHFNVKGYQKIGETVFDTVVKKILSL